MHGTAGTPSRMALFIAAGTLILKVEENGGQVSHSRRVHDYFGSPDRQFLEPDHYPGNRGNHQQQTGQ